MGNRWGIFFRSEVAERSQRHQIQKLAHVQDVLNYHHGCWSKDGEDCNDDELWDERGLDNLNKMLEWRFRHAPSEDHVWQLDGKELQSVPL